MYIVVGRYFKKLKEFAWIPKIVFIVLLINAIAIYVPGQGLRRDISRVYF